MAISSLAATQYDAATRIQQPAAKPPGTDTSDSTALRGAFQDFVGQTFYGQMLHAMRSSVGKPAYFYGGRTEEVFQNQLDQVLAEKMSEATAETFTQPMFELFELQRR
jgi:peptidoglycan hydrolase FlgJ